MPNIAYANLEIGLSNISGTRYRVELRYWPLNSDTIEPAATCEVQLDPRDYLGLGNTDYGQKLSASLFACERVRTRFLQARQDTYAQINPGSAGLRVRLWFDSGTEALFDLRWELLTEPQPPDVTIPPPPGTPNPAPLSVLDLVPFSRFPSSVGSRSILLRPKSQLRVLVVIAGPNFNEQLDDKTTTLAQVDVNAEWDRVRTALSGLQAPTLLASHPDAAGSPRRAQLLDALTKGNFDIVYIVCHGTLDRDGPTLLLESDAAGGDAMPGATLVETIQGLPQPPRLMVLTACQSAGTGRSTANSAQMALGAQLVRAGVPAVLAMNGKVSQATSGDFYQHFFGELQQDGCIDRAMSSARRFVKGLPGSTDWWMPVLYTRLARGYIWSLTHLIARDQEPYEELSTSLKYDQCTPIIGPGLLEPLWGSLRSVARDWASTRGFPLAPYLIDELPTVAQFLARRRTGKSNRKFVIQTWVDAMVALLQKKWPGLAADVGGIDGLLPLAAVSRLASAAGARMRQQDPPDPPDPYALLARLPVSIYLSATPDPLLVDALQAVKRTPVVDYARWTDALKLKPLAFDENNKSQLISREKPLVYYLFGTLADADSLVVTEDDYFDYLIHVVKDAKNTAIPNLVRTAWSTNALMFLGFDLDDWMFRILYRIITQEEGHKLRLEQGPLSAAVQLNPEEDRNLQPELALQYLEQVFGSQQISLSWDQPQDFLLQVLKLLPLAFGGLG